MNTNPKRLPPCPKCGGFLSLKDDGYRLFVSCINCGKEWVVKQYLHISKTPYVEDDGLDQIDNGESDVSQGQQSKRLCQICGVDISRKKITAKICNSDKCLYERTRSYKKKS